MLFTLFLACSSYMINAQSCDELIRLVKAESYGTTYSSYTSEAISKVTFYDVTMDNQRFCFAIICFNGKAFGCSQYIYQIIGPNLHRYH